MRNEGDERVLLSQGLEAEMLSDLAFELHGEVLRKMEVKNLAFRGNEELAEVPWDVLYFASLWVLEAGVFLQVLEQGNGVFSVDLDLVEQVKLHSVLASRELLDFGISAGLLVKELVAREAPNR